MQAVRAGLRSALFAVALLGACGKEETVPSAAQAPPSVSAGPTAPAEPTASAAADHTFLLTVDRSAANFVALPELVTLTRKSAYSSSDPRKFIRTVPPVHPADDLSSVWSEQPDASIILTFGDIDTAVVLTMRSEGPGRWVGEASFHDYDGSVKTLATPARLELRDA